MIKLELLPNEILLSCFQYFDAIQLFDSFEGLNYRFNQLIRQAPLHLNFIFVRKSIFDQFCTRLLSDDQIRNQVYSLKLSNQNVPKQIDIFLSKFQLDQFSHLRSLVLNETTGKNIDELNTVLPRIPELHHLDIYKPKSNVSVKLSIPKLKSLYIDDFSKFNQILSVTHLSIGTWSKHSNLVDIFTYLPLLKYFRVELIGTIRNQTFDKNCVKAFHLKHFIVRNFLMPTFENLKHIFRHTPNLTNLTILSGVFDYINPSEVQETIESFLPLLKNFKFKFYSPEPVQADRVKRIFKGFQTNFWHQQHQWFTDHDNSSIYTRSYPLDTYTSLYACNKVSMNLNNAFDEIRCLNIDPKDLLHDHQFYLAKIPKLELGNGSKNEQTITNVNVQQLRSIIDFTYIKCLHIEENFIFEYSSDLFELLRQQTNLRELTIPHNLLASFIQYCELYEDFQVGIRILNIVYQQTGEFTIFDFTEILPRFQYVFNNLETFTGSLRSIENIIYLITHFTKLSTCKIWIYSNENLEDELEQLKIILSERNAIHDINKFQGFTTIHIWI